MKRNSVEASFDKNKIHENLPKLRRIPEIPFKIPDSPSIADKREPETPLTTSSNSSNFIKNSSQISLINSAAKSAEDPGIYHAFRPTVLFAMFFAMTPLTNATGASSRTLSFRWLSVQTAYTLIILISLSFIASLSVTYYFVGPVTTSGFGTVAIRLMGPLFYTSACVSMALTFSVTRKLPAIFRRWDQIASRLIRYSRPKTRIQWPYFLQENATHRVTVLTTSLVTFCFMFSAIFEHTLHDVNFFSDQNCTNETDFIGCYLSATNDFVEGTLGDVRPVMVAAYVLNKYANFAWNFHDLLLIQLSLALRKNFKVIAEYLERTKDEAKSVLEWRRLREDHLALCELVDTVDDAVAPMVLLSFAVSIYFLAHQLFMGIRPTSGSLLETVYVIASFGHLVGRVVTVTFSASSLFDQVLEPLQFLHHCPDTSYNKEVHRFINQIIYNNVGLTGCKFFVVNRSFFLATVSVIVTYELLLLDVN